jgi:hypothetical protein
MTSKKRGAQSGNHNAFRHGFYSSAFKDRERRLLSSMPATDLAAEIDLIRVANYRFLQALNAVPGPLDVETQLAALRAVNLSAQSIASLIRAQALTSASGEADTLAGLLESLGSDPEAAGLPGLNGGRNPSDTGED